MDLFEESFRTISTRGITLSKKQMETFRIKKVYNSFGNPEFFSIENAEKMLEELNCQGEFCLMEAACNSKINIFSIITFEDIFSRNVYALMNSEYYNGYPYLETLKN